MRYLIEEQLRTHLSLGKAVEQWLKPYGEDDCTYIRWVRIIKENSGQFNVFYTEAVDEGNLDFLDVYEFSSKDPDEPYGVIDTFDTIAEALNFAISKYNVSLTLFVNDGMIQNEYKDHLMNS